MKRKMVLALPLFFLGAAIFFHKSKESELIFNEKDSSGIPVIAVNQSVNNYSSVAVSSISPVIIVDEPWIPYSVAAKELDQIGSLIGYGDEQAAFQFIEISTAYFDKLEVGDIVELSIPGASAVDMNITSINRDAGVRSVVGHLSGYSDAYYIGFTYDDNGDVYGDVTTEKGNYSVRTYNNKTVIFKNFSDANKSFENDY